MSWTMPGTLPPGARLHGEHGPAAALGDEVLLQVLAEAAGARELPSSSATRCRPSRSCRAQLAERGEALSRRSEPSSSTRGSIESASGASAGSTAAASSRSSGAVCSASSSAARARSAPPIVSATCAARGREHAAAGRERRGLRTSRDAVERRLGGVVEQRDRLRRQRLAARDLAGSGEGTSARASSAPGARRGRVREPLRDRRKLE